MNKKHTRDRQAGLPAQRRLLVGGKENSETPVRLSALWGIVASYLAVLAFAIVPNEQRFPAIIVSALVFGLVQVLCPACRPIVTTPICPWNWALGIFFIQLVVMPLCITFWEPYVGPFTALPSDFATNIALLIQTIAFLAFCVTYQYLHSRSARLKNHPGVESDSSKWVSSHGLIAVYGAAGLFGLFLAFGDFATLFKYFTDPTESIYLTQKLAGTVRGVASLFLRPFLGFALIMLWCRWIDQHGRKRSFPLAVALTVLVVGLVCLSFATFGHNRAAFVVPLIAMAAVSTAKRHTAPSLVLAAVCVPLLLIVPAYGVYRRSDFTVQEVFAKPAVRDVLAGRVDFVNMVQLYAGAPQFLGLLLERIGWQKSPDWGGSLLSSLLYPIPIVGKSFRPTSTVMVYNELFYGKSGFLDQVVPFQGELFINFHLAGVVVGYCLLGWVAFLLQRSFTKSAPALKIYALQYASIWIFFLTFGSLAVVSQILVYFFWPIYAYLLLRLASKVGRQPNLEIAQGRQARPREGIGSSGLERRNV